METPILQLGLSIPGMFLPLLAGIIIVKSGTASRKICVTTKYQFKKRQFSCTLPGNILLSIAHIQALIVKEGLPSAQTGGRFMAWAGFQADKIEK